MQSRLYHGPNQAWIHQVLVGQRKARIEVYWDIEYEGEADIVYHISLMSSYGTHRVYSTIWLMAISELKNGVHN